MQLHAQLSENHSPIIIRIITIILIACTPCKCVYICILYIHRERERAHQTAASMQRASTALIAGAGLAGCMVVWLCRYHMILYSGLTTT